MGQDLHWKITPKPLDEQYNSLYMSTWNLLAEIFKVENEHIHDVELTKSSINELNAIRLTAKYCNSEDISKDILELITAINLHGSITLVIK